MAGTSDRKLLMGRIGAAHGIKGEVRIVSFTEEPLALLDYGPLTTNRPGFNPPYGGASAAGYFCEAGRRETRLMPMSMPSS